MTQVAPGAMGAFVHVSVAAKLPKSETLVTVRGAVPVFVSVMVFGLLASPTGCFPKLRLDGFNFTAGATPRPVKPTVCVPELPLMTSWLLCTPSDVGWKVTLIEHVWPTPRLEGQVSDFAKS